VADPLEIIGPRNGAAPLSYEIVESGTVDLQSVFARFDGSLASGPWRAALTIRAQNGTILGRVFPSDELAAGDSADVTFAPFLRGAATATPVGRRYQFDTDPQAGTWLYVETTGNAGAPHGYGLEVVSEERMHFHSNSSDIDIEAPGGQVTVQSISGTGSGFVQIESDGSVNTAAENDFATLTDGAGGQFTVRSGIHPILSAYEGGGTEFYMPEVGDYVAFYGETATALKVDRADNAVNMPSLPTSDPGVSGQLWNSGGTVKVSP
jgi:hypothetical protein